MGSFINMKRNGIDNAYLLPTEFHKQIDTRCVSKGHFIKPLKWKEMQLTMHIYCQTYLSTVECFKGHLMKPLKWKEI